MSDAILIVGSRTDPHIVAVTDHLDRGGHQFLILDSYDESSDGIVHQFTDNAILKVAGSEFNTNSIKSVLWRQKPKFVIPNDTVSNLYDYYFQANEWRHVHQFLRDQLEKSFCINSSQADRSASNKLYQLKLARSCGFITPRTLVTNCTDTAANFMKFIDGPVIFKTLNPYMNPVGLLTYTTVIECQQLLENRSSLQLSPGIFQEYIEKEFELRVTVVGRQIFASRINSGFSKESQVDWRSDIYSDLYDKYEFDGQLSRQLIELHMKFGLVYGAYDFIFSKKKEMIFLEVNPVGQWLWLEHRLELPISNALSAALSRASVE